MQEYRPVRSQLGKHLYREVREISPAPQSAEKALYAVRAESGVERGYQLYNSEGWVGLPGAGD